MKLLKSMIIVMLIGIITISCKKAPSTDESADAVDEVIEVVETTDDTSPVESEAVEGVTEGIEELTSSESVSTDDIPSEASAEISAVYPKDTKLAGEVNGALKDLVAGNPALKSHFSKAYGYAIFPKITKAGLGVGGAGGKGLVFQNNKVIGSAKMAQATLGLQAGAQQYAEVVFFENKEALDKFKSGKLKFSGQASAVALKDGASVDMAYQDGVAIFTKSTGGVMAEASLGGQKFTYLDGI